MASGVRTVTESEFKQILHVCHGPSLLFAAGTLLSWRDGSRQDYFHQQGTMRGKTSESTLKIPTQPHVQGEK